MFLLQKPKIFANVSASLLEGEVVRPKDIEIQFDSDLLDSPVYLMLALSYDLQRMDGTREARHPYDSAARDEARNLEEKTTLFERKDIISHDLGEEVGGNVVGAYVVNGIVSYLLNEKDMYGVLNVLTDHYAFLWKPIKEKFENQRKREPKCITIEDIIDEFESQKRSFENSFEGRIKKDDLFNLEKYYIQIKEKITRFRNYIEVQYEKIERVRNSLLSDEEKEEQINCIESGAFIKVSHLDSQEVGYLLKLYDVFYRRLIEDKDHLLHEYLPAKIFSEVSSYYDQIIDTLKNGLLEVDKRQVIRTEVPILLNVSKTLYNKCYIGRLMDFSREKAANSSPIYDAAIISKLRESEDNTRTLSKSFDKMRNIYQKIRCITRETTYIIDELEEDGKDVRRMKYFRNLLFETLERKIKDYRSHAFDDAATEKSFENHSRILDIMEAKNKILKHELGLSNTLFGKMATYFHAYFGRKLLQKLEYS